MNRPPYTEKMEPGGPYGEVDCTRCGDPATRSYEGNKFLQLCESCWRQLGVWLNIDSDKTLKSSKGDTE